MSIYTSPKRKAPLQNRAELQNLYSTSYQSHIEERQRFVVMLVTIVLYAFFSGLSTPFQKNFIPLLQTKLSIPQRATIFQLVIMLSRYTRRAESNSLRL